MCEQLLIRGTQRQFSEEYLFTPGWDAPKNGTFSVSGFSGIKFQNGRSFVCMDLHINQLEYIITRVAMICGIQ